MTPQELKASILQLAIQGKLVEQRPEEGSGGELLEKIAAEKGLKGSKRSKGCSRYIPSIPTISSISSIVPPAATPFDIPESWVWVRLGEVVFNHGQKKPTGDFSYIDIGSIDNKNQRLSDAETIVHPENASPRARKIVQKGDVIYATVRPYLHNVCVIDREFSREPIASTGFAVMACADCLDNKYLFYFLLSPDFDRYANSSENAKGVAYPAISDKRLYDALIPLPPLAEQKRIVAKLEELLPLIDRYEKAWSKLEDFNKRFPGDMQKSLLQMAIQGKLVDQRAEEGTGEELLWDILTQRRRDAECAEKKLTRGRGARGGGIAPSSHVSCPMSTHPSKNISALSAPPREEIPDSEKPFDIPESWVWVRLEEVTDMLAGFAFKSSDFKAKGKHRLLRGINLAVGDVRWKDKDTVYVDTVTDRMSEYRLKKGDVLIGLDRPWITDGTRVAVFEDDMETYLVQRVLRLREIGCLISAYIALLLHSALLRDSIGDKTTGISVPHISPGQVGNLVIPLPPLAEQKRIVAKLEELLPLCERLK